ncbi:mucin-like protein [Dreissena polymorpha]|nr:mucin-like protein [Dreissena polymorpha]
MASGSATDVAILNTVKSVFAKYYPASFSPQYAFIATWNKLKYSTSSPETVTFQAILATDYKTTYYVTVYEDDGMQWTVPMSGVPGSNNEYVARVAMYCGPTDKYTYDYSQLSYGQISNKSKIERIQNVYQIYSGFGTDAAALFQMRKASGSISYGDADGSVPAYGRRGIFVFVLNTVTFHPALSCKSWLSSAAAINDSKLAQRCPATKAQMVAPSRFTRTVVGDYEFFFMPGTKSHEGMNCGYLLPGKANAGTLIDKSLYKLVNGSNLYSLYRGRSSSDADYVAEQAAYSDCCRTGDGLTTQKVCDMYLAKRPPCDGSTFVAGGAGGGEGDPHITTLDGFKYTFNGHGEYVLLRGDMFELQGRAARAVVDGAESDATIIVSVAAKQKPDGTRVEFRVNEDGTGIVIYINGSEETIDFSQYPNGKGYAQVILEKAIVDGTDTFRMVFYSGIVVNANPTSGLLSLSMALTSDWSGKVKGLMGNFNGNKNDEFIKPDGTSLGNSSAFTEQQIFEQYGNLWKISEAESLFTYKTGETWASMKDDSFTPKFFNPNLEIMFPNATERTNAQNICYKTAQTDPDPSARRECYFDFAVLKDATLAQNTANNIQKVTEEQTALANFPPQITNGDVTLELTEGALAVAIRTLNVIDSNGDAVTFAVVNGSVAGLAVNSSTGAVTLASVPATHPFSITISASDGTAITLWEPKIKYCACKNAGVCDFNVTTTTQFTVVPCNCPAAWEGAFCEKDKDGCKENPCYTGVKCTDVPAGLLSSQPAGFKCDSCPLGLQGNGQDCQDVDECLQTTPKVCDQICTNKVGSYTCSCNSGYMLQPDLKTCLDYDECALNEDDCDSAATCTNTVGSFNCTCKTGYSGTGISGECADVNECTSLSKPCPDNSTCTNNEGSFTCPCDAGYQYNSVSGKCENIDDCKLSGDCSQVCVDGLNTFMCSCQAGFVLNSDQKTCAPSTACSTEQANNCNGGNSSISTCAVNNGEVVCVCHTGYSLNAQKMCEDINECTTGTHACQSATCANTVGGYTCTCKAGFKFSSGSTRVCEDINECTTGTHSCGNATCVNNPGSFACTCSTGFLFFNGTGCLNINECSNNSTNNCDVKYGVCTDTDGGYTCACAAGYTGNGYTCVDLNECDTTNGGCAQGCTNTIGGHSCYCGQGYVLNADGRACNDVNECASSSTNGCYNNTYCTNTAGKFTCTCPMDFELKADGFTCQSIHVCASSNECAYTCNRIGGIDTCTCEKGYQLNTDGAMCSDINECAVSGSTLCPVSNNVICQNTVGGYTCVCKSDKYRKVEEARCVNIDECLNSPCAVNADCQDQDPGYTCTCKTGFTSVAGTCTDINECTAGTHACHATFATCTNTQGSYSCQCKPGYQGNGETCTEINECALGTHACDTSVGTCTNTAGSYTCACAVGFALGPNQQSCVDVNECTTGTHGCGHSCTNTAGSFTCTCKSGFRLAGDQRSCIVEVACSSNLTTLCSQSCAKVSGNDTCVCVGGYVLAANGYTCVDVNECSPSNPCGSNHSVCTNTAGGYMCSCSDGYTKGANNECVDRNGGFTQWSLWNICSVTCGSGVTSRTRTCTNPTREGSGAPCTGDTSETKTCTLDPCAISVQEQQHGLDLTIKGLTIDQFNNLKVQFQDSVASGLNTFCRASETNARVCCQNTLRYTPTSSMLFMSDKDVIISNGYPTLDGDNNLIVYFVAKYSSNNSLCASGSAGGRKRRQITLNSIESLMSQATLLSLFQAQQSVILSTFITQATVMLGTASSSITFVAVAVIDDGQPDSKGDGSKRPSDLVIVLAVVGSVIGAALIVLIVVLVIKAQKADQNRVNPVSVQAASLNNHPNGHQTRTPPPPQVIGYIGDEGAMRGKADFENRRRSQNPPDNRVLTIAPVDDPYLSHV